MKDKVCIVTGASSGIGKATTLALAGMGATVVMVCRNSLTGEPALAEVKASSGNPRVELILADLSSQEEIHRLVGEFKARYDRLHVLVNNAGLALTRRHITVDGLEMVFAVNYLAPFLLSNLLLDTLKASAPARIINVAGDYHRRATIQFDDLMSEKNYSALKANNQAKLALILFTYELARRLAAEAKTTSVTVNCLHPGAVATGVVERDPDLSAMSRLMYNLVKPFFLTPEKGAATSVYLASSPDVEGITGKYFINRASVQSSSESYSQEIAKNLWQVSAQLTGLALPA